MSEPAATPNILNLDGIATAKPPGSGLFFRNIPLEGWCISRGDRSYEIGDLCRDLDYGFRSAIMEDVEYEMLVGAMPQFVAEGGLSADCPVGSGMFEQFLAKFPESSEINKFLYFYDCERLVSSVSQCLMEVNSAMGDFYYTLNMDFRESNATRLGRDGVVTTRSGRVTRLMAYLNFIFIRLHSLLDYSVKLAVESESIKTDFSRYPKMRSLSAQFGHRRDVSFNGAAGTLFERCPFIDAVETLRNHVIHDGLLEEQPKLFERVDNGVVVERFVLFPDMTDGRFDRYGNRNLFYGGEDKINLRLPDFVLEFQARLEATLALIVEGLRRQRVPPSSAGSV